MGLLRSPAPCRNAARDVYGSYVMTAKDRTTDVKHELAHGLEKLATLRDEAKLHLHLATLDAKQEWDERLDPTIA